MFLWDSWGWGERGLQPHWLIYFTLNKVKVIWAAAAAASLLESPSSPDRNGMFYSCRGGGDDRLSCGGSHVWACSLRQWLVWGVSYDEDTTRYHGTCEVCFVLCLNFDPSFPYGVCHYIELNQSSSTLDMDHSQNPH